MGDKKHTSDQYQGLPLSHLIGGSLSALCEGQAQLARTTKEFIEDVAIENGTLRVVDFTFNRPVEEITKKGTVEIRQQQYRVEVPFISLISVPNLQIDSADLHFTMEVKDSLYTDRKDTSNKNEDTEADSSGSVVNLNFNQRKRTVLTGSVSSKQRTDTTAALDINIKASQQGVPEGLARVLDMLHRSIVPIELGEPKPVEGITGGDDETS